MIKPELINCISNKINIDKKYISIIHDEIFNQIAQVLKQNDSYNILGFGTFSTIEIFSNHDNCLAINSDLEISQKRVVNFKVAKRLDELISEKL